MAEHNGKLYSEGHSCLCWSTFEMVFKRCYM